VDLVAPKKPLDVERLISRSRQTRCFDFSQFPLTTENYLERLMAAEARRQGEARIFDDIRQMADEDESCENFSLEVIIRLRERELLLRLSSPLFADIFHIKIYAVGFDKKTAKMGRQRSK
jgi:hypothetical protein